MTAYHLGPLLKMMMCQLLAIVFIFPAILINNIANADSGDAVTATRGGIEKFDRSDADGEWSGASSTEKFNTTRALFRRNGDNLLVLVIVETGPDNDDQSTINLYFDTEHDHTAPHDIHIEIQRNNTTPQKNGSAWLPSDFIIKDTNPIDPFGDTSCNSAPCGIFDLPAGGHAWSAEIKISALDLELAFLPAIMGISVETVIESPTGVETSKWPAGFQEENPSTWANLKTRLPNHYALVFDNSGSMRATDGLSLGSRWQRTKRAADLFVAAAGLFKSPYFDDRISLSQYSWSCSDSSAAGNTTGEVDGLADMLNPVPIPDAPGQTDVTFTQGNSTEPDPNNCTPIKRGIDFALEEQLGFGSTSDQENRIILLLSDGLHNQPPDDVPLDLNTFTDPQKEFAAIRTVAMGDDCCIDTSLLQDIADAFHGASPAAEARYNYTTDFQELLGAYIESLQEPLSINEIPAAPGGLYHVGEVKKLVVIGVWNDPSLASELTIGIQGSSDDDVTGTKFNQTIGYAAVEKENPIAGAWELKGAASPDKVYFLVDLRVMAKFLVEQKPYGAGETILLQVRLNDRAEPILDAEVAVEVAKPGEGLGNLLSTIQEDCSIGFSAGLQSIQYRFNPQAGKFRLPVTVRGAQSLTGDPLIGRHALGVYHMERCKMDGLGRQTLPGKLYDDGSHGDPRAGDGIYSLAFGHTDKEGSYQFRFHVRGATTDGMRFARTRTLSQYLRINPDRQNSPIVFEPADPTQDRQTGIISILPRDRLGNYLGPGFYHRIKFKTTAGKFIQPLADHGNGAYSRLLSYDKEKDRPKVSIEMGGKLIGRLKVVKDFDLVLPFIGWFVFDDELDLEDGPLVGARFGYRLTNPLTIELEAGNTFTESTTGDAGNVGQAMLNFRYALTTQKTAWGQLSPFATVGVGYLFFNGFGNDDEAFAGQGGAGASLYFNDTIGIRLDARIFRVASVMDADASLNYQATGGLVIKF